MQEYITYLKNDQKDKKTIEAYTKTILEFQKWYSDTTGYRFMPDTITPLDIKDYISWLSSNQKQMPRTTNKKLGALKSYFGFATEESYITINPAIKVKAKRISTLQQSPRWLTRHEQARLLHCIYKIKNPIKQSRDYAIAQLMLQAGLRVFEVSALNVEDINFRRNTLTISEGKGQKMAILPINKNLRKALEVYLNIRASENEALFVSNKKFRLSDRGIQYQFRKYFDQINLPDTTVHSLRHTFCKNLLDQGVDLTVVAQLARHESLDTTRLYVTPGERDLRLAVERISGDE